MNTLESEIRDQLDNMSGPGIIKVGWSFFEIQWSIHFCQLSNRIHPSPLVKCMNTTLGHSIIWRLMQNLHSRSIR